MIGSHLKHFFIDIRMVLLIFLCFCHFLTEAQQERHYLHYMFTALSKADTMPDFSAVGAFDDRQIKHYSNKKRVWILTANDQTKNAPENPPDSRDWFLHQMKILSNCADSQCSELHVLQRVIGCELEKLPDGTVSLRAFDEYGFDGEDFMAFDSDTLQWIDKNPKAKETKKQWDQQTERKQFLNYFLHTCMDWISAFNYTNIYTSSPDVHIFVTENSQSKLTCLATDFYPRNVEVNIRFNRTIIEYHTSSGIRPNEDGSFQLSTHVEINRNHKEFYDCLVIHSTLRKPAEVFWDGTCIDCKTNYTWMVLAGVASVLAAFGILAVFCMYRDGQYRKQFNSYKPHEWMALMRMRYERDEENAPMYFDLCGRKRSVFY